MASRQPFAEGEWKLLAADPDPATKAGPNRPLVGVLTLPSGARVLAAGHVSAPYGEREGGEGSWLDTAELLPAGSNSELALAWSSYRDTTQGTSDKTVQTAALGPVGTVTVEWTGPDGVTTSPARNTLASTSRTDVRSVRFLDAAGAEVGTTAVRRPEAMKFSDDPQFLMESKPSWLLPEVRKALIAP